VYIPHIVDRGRTLFMFPKKLLSKALLASAALSVLCTGISLADDMKSCANLPKPTPEHAWLKQFVGEWESENEMYMEPGKAPLKSKGTDSVKPLGEYWILSDVKSTMMDKPFSGQMTIGYDAEKKQYVATWVDSMTGQLWTYDGRVEGKALVLETEGACPMNPGKLSKFKETIELKDKDHQVFTSYIQGPDGQWIPMMVSRSHRK
jgi:hypothetical protein